MPGIMNKTYVWRCLKESMVKYWCLGFCCIPSYTNGPIKLDIGLPTLFGKLS